MLELYLGGARSGKSRLAEQRVCGLGGRRLYIATATAGDTEMAARIHHHQQQRCKDGWTTVEAPEQLSAALREHSAKDSSILVDCLTLWLSNWILKDDAQAWQRSREEFLAVISRLPGNLVLVSNEVGQGIVPMGEINRRFVDEAGRLHQAIAGIADRVVLVTAGIEQVIKDNKT